MPNRNTNRGSKKIRREYYKKYGRDYSPRRAKELKPRTDGKANCLTTGITREHLIFNISPNLICKQYYQDIAKKYLKNKNSNNKNYIQTDISGKGNCSQDQRIYLINNKIGTLSANGTQSKIKILDTLNGDIVRKLTPVECERLQCFPDNWTEGISNTQRYKGLGNAFNVAVIEHILKELTRRT